MHCTGQSADLSRPGVTEQVWHEAGGEFWKRVIYGRRLIRIGRRAKQRPADGSGGFDVGGIVAGLWDLVVEHEAWCGWGNLGEMAARHKKDRDNSTGKAMAEIIAYDRHLRRLVVEKSGIDPQILDFLFGRSLEKILAMI